MLHWFGLTDSYYWLDFDAVQLLRYSDEFVEFYQMNQQLPYVDYQFARIFWDFTGIVRDVLAPIPDEVFEDIRTFADLEAYLGSLANWLNDEWDGTDEAYDSIYLPAGQWVAERRLDFSYLIGAPRIYFFRNGERVYIRWIADDVDTNGIRVWQTAKGECVMDLDPFIAALQQSLQAFAQAMGDQVNWVLDHPIDKVFIDRAKLLANHEEFLQEVEAYDNVLSFVFERSDWGDVLSKMKIINRESQHNAGRRTE